MFLFLQFHCLLYLAAIIFFNKLNCVALQRKIGEGGKIDSANKIEDKDDVEKIDTKVL